MKDFTILTLKPALAREKNEVGRNYLRTIYESLIVFLQNNNLITRELLCAKGTIRDDFKLMRSDLTDEGFKVLQQTMTKWLDKVTDPEDVSMLERKLYKLRKETP